MTKKNAVNPKTLYRLAAALILTAIFSSSAFAVNLAMDTPRGRSRSDYGSGVSRKLGRGVANTGLGWVEVLNGVSKVNEENGIWAGLTWGPIQGAWDALRRTTTGVYELATFPIPDGEAGFDPILEPEFVLQDRQK